jgi:hypothetical protein
MELYGNKAFLDLWNSQKILIRDMRVIQMRNKPNEFSGLMFLVVHSEVYFDVSFGGKIWSYMVLRVDISGLIPKIR